LFLDSDISVPENFLERLLDHMTTSEVVMAKLRSPNDDPKSWTELPAYWRHCRAFCLAVKRTALFRAGPFDPRLADNELDAVDLGFRLFKQGSRFAFMDTKAFRRFSRSEQKDSTKPTREPAQSVWEFFVLRPERQTFAVCQDHFAPAFPQWLLSLFRKPAAETEYPDA
jgi:hypothetical protein